MPRLPRLSKHQLVKVFIPHLALANPDRLVLLGKENVPVRMLLLISGNILAKEQAAQYEQARAARAPRAAEGMCILEPFDMKTLPDRVYAMLVDMNCKSVADGCNAWELEIPDSAGRPDFYLIDSLLQLIEYRNVYKNTSITVRMWLEKHKEWCETWQDRPGKPIDLVTFIHATNPFLEGPCTSDNPNIAVKHYYFERETRANMDVEEFCVLYRSYQEEEVLPSVGDAPIRSFRQWLRDAKRFDAGDEASASSASGTLREVKLKPLKSYMILSWI